MTINKFNQADHHGGNDNCLSPPRIVQDLGPFDLDPCFGLPRPWASARRMWALEDGQDGLELPWHDRVWLNPPYSNAASWAKKMDEHGNGIMLIFSRTETAWFQRHVLDARSSATGIGFIRRRLRFSTPDGSLIKTKKGKVSNAGAPSCLISYGTQNDTAIQKLFVKGALASLDKEAPNCEGIFVPLQYKMVP